MIIGVIIKIIGLVTKVIITRTIKTDGLALYSMITPTIGLMLTITSLSLPITINKFVAKNRTNSTYSNRGIILKCFCLSMIITTILSLIFIININYLVNTLLSNDKLYFPLLLSIPLLFLASFSNILKGYLTGIKKQEIVITNQLIETLVKLLIIILVSFFFFKENIVKLVSLVILSITLSEIASIVHLLYKVKKITSFTLKINKEYESDIKPIIKESINITLTRLVSSICIFFEPIIFTQCLLYIGLKNDIIAKSYGIIEGYTLNLLLFTTFIIYSLCSFIIPLITENYNLKNYDKIKKLLNNIFLIVCFIAGLSTVVMKVYSKELMYLLYRTTEGTNYIEYMAFFFILSYFTPILVCINQSINNINKIFFINLFSVIIRLTLIYKLCVIPEINIHGINISNMVTLLFNFIFLYLLIRDVYRFSIKNIFYFVSSVLLIYYTAIFLNKIINFYFIPIFLITLLYIILFFTFYKMNKKKLFVFD